MKSLHPNRRRIVLTALAASLLVSAGYAAISTFWAQTSMTFTIGTPFTTGGLRYAVNVVGNNYTPCTLTSGTTYTCPVSSALFIGDVVTVQVSYETDKNGVQPQMTFSNTGNAVFSTTISTGTNINCESPFQYPSTPPFVSGIPTLTAGTCYTTQLDAVLSSGSGSTTLSFALGTA
jgi:hypothetical protein